MKQEIELARGQSGLSRGTAHRHDGQPEAGACRGDSDELQIDRLTLRIVRDESCSGRYPGAPQQGDIVGPMGSGAAAERQGCHHANGNPESKPRDIGRSTQTTPPRSRQLGFVDSWGFPNGSKHDSTLPFGGGEWE